MLSIKNLTKSYDGRVLFENLDFSLKSNEVVGLIGENGVGKSTLFKIIAGGVRADAGSVDAHGESLGYLPQNLALPHCSVGDFLRKELSKDGSDAYRVDYVLGLLGLSIDKSQNCLALSGGQKTKVYLASMLLRAFEPTVLLLDEPTNNLDIDGMNWLVNFIKSFRGGVLLTSHDRYFLDEVCSRTVELKAGKMRSYGGNYSFYCGQKELEAQACEKMYVVQQKQIAKTQSMIQESKNEAQKFESKFSSRQPFQKKKASKSVRSAVVKEKRLEKLLNSAERLAKPENFQKYGVELAGANPQGKLMLSVNDVSFEYSDGKQVLSHMSFDMFGSERLWLMGSNGSGKTTLLKLIVGRLVPIGGAVKLGTGIKVGYFSQDASMLDAKNIGIDELLAVCKDSTECFRMAAHLHLTEDDMRTKISNLSSGQRIKLEFAKLLLADNNLLILDEPTNHLEISTREEIETALQDYGGAVLVVSHDRYFVEKLGVDRVVEL